MMRLLCVGIIFFGFSLAEARGLRPITERLPKLLKRAEIGKFVATAALGTMLLCAPSCEYGDRMVDGGFTRSGNPVLGSDAVTYSGTDLAYSLGNIVGDQRTGTIQETHHRGIDVQIGLGVTTQALVVTLNRPNPDKGKTFEERFTVYLGAVNDRSFDIYDSYGGTDIGDGYAWDNGQRRYNFDAGNGVELSLLIRAETTANGVQSRVLRRLYASKEVIDGQDHRGQPIIRNEKFSWLGLPTSHFLRIGTNATLTLNADN